MAKITESDAETIRQLHSSGVEIAELSKLYDISTGYLNNILYDNRFSDFSASDAGLIARQSSAHEPKSYITKDMIEVVKNQIQPGTLIQCIDWGTDDARTRGKPEWKVYPVESTFNEIFTVNKGRYIESYQYKEILLGNWPIKIVG